MGEEIADIWDLAGRQICIRPLRGYLESLSRVNAKLFKRDMPPIRIINASEFLTTEDILELVNAGIVDYGVAESHVAALWSRILPNLKVYDRVSLHQGGSVAWTIRKNNPQLKASLNEFIESHKKGTLLGNIYFNRYFKNTQWIKNPLEPNDWGKFSRYAPLFKKYGTLYGIDWMNTE